MIDTTPINLLNELLEIDRVAITKLCSQRVPTNGGFDNHPSVQVTKDSELGLLGILNYLLSYIDSSGQRIYVIAIYGEDGLISEFKL
jgi:hypothetical protein